MNTKHGSFLIVWLFNWSIRSILILPLLCTSNSAEGRDDPPVFLQSFADARDEKGSRLWMAPSYKNQEKRLGYTQKSFSVPPSLERRVNFWKEIYSKYTSNHGLLHDANEIDLIYEVVELPTVKSTGLAKQFTEAENTL